MLDYFDWTPFYGKKGGDTFENLCLDLLIAMNLDARATGEGGDKGKDIIVMRYPAPGWGINGEPASYVECKSRNKRAKALSMNDFPHTFVTILTDNIRSLLILTNHRLNNTVHECISAINSNPKIDANVSWMEKEELEAALVCHPDLCRKYFNEMDVGACATKLKASRPALFDRIQTAVTPTSKFISPDAVLRVELVNRTPGQVSINLRGTAGNTSLQLRPFERRHLDVPLQSGREKWPELTLETTSGQEKHRRTLRAEGTPQVRVDHLYVDPFGLKNTLADMLKAKGYAIVLGTAGSGKSRLLAETAGLLGRELHWIDLSENSYSRSLSDCLLDLIFGLDANGAAELPPEVLRHLLMSRGIASTDVETLLHLVQGKAKLDRFAVAATMAIAARKSLGDHLLVVDNIHHIGPFDLEIVRNLLAMEDAPTIVFSARGNEITHNELNVWLRNVSSPHVLILDEIDRERVQEEFIKKAAADDSTRRFLNRFLNPRSIQEFVFNLKEFKARGILQQSMDGRFGLGEPSTVGARAYDELYRSLIAVIGDSFNMKEVEDVLQAAAVFGYEFPREFIEVAVGPHGNGILDRLERLEVLVAKGPRQIRFDHELTHACVDRGIGFSRRLSFHRKAIEFLSSPERVRGRRDHIVLAPHLEAVGSYLEAATHYHEAAKVLKREGRLSDAAGAASRACMLIVENREEIAKDASDQIILPLEFEAVELLFILQQALGDRAEARAALSALHVVAHDMTAYEDMRGVKARLKGYAADLEKDRSLRRQYASEAAQELARHGNAEDYGRSLVRLGNLDKQDGSFLSAARTTAQALRILRRARADSTRAEALLDFGAIFLECGRGRKVPYWWRRGAEAQRRAFPQDISRIAFADADYAYSLALFRPADTETGLALDLAYEQAKRCRLRTIQSRAALNWANWLFFDRQDADGAWSLLSEARQLAQSAGDDYKVFLGALSCLNFQLADAVEPEDGVLGYIEGYILGRGEPAGDQRLRNATALLLALGREKVFNALSKRAKSLWRPYLGIGLGDGLRERELDNPYYKGKGYATYY